MNKYIKKFNEDFNLTDEISKNAMSEIEELSDEIKIYNSRKGNLKSLIMGNVDGKKDISKNIEDITKDNRFLKMYLVILNSMANLDKLKKNIENYRDRISDKKIDLNDAASITDSNIKNKTLSNINKDIAELNKKIQGVNTKMSETNKDLLTKENELKKTLSDEEKRLKDMLNHIKNGK